MAWEVAAQRDCVASATNANGRELVVIAHEQATNYNSATFDCTAFLSQYNAGLKHIVVQWAWGGDGLLKLRKIGDGGNC